MGARSTKASGKTPRKAKCQTCGKSFGSEKGRKAHVRMAHPDPAQSSGGAARPIGRPFKPGQSGNPGGRPKIPSEVVEACRAHTLDAIETLVKVMEGDHIPSRVRAAEALLDRAWGRATQPMEITGKDGGPIESEQKGAQPDASPDRVAAVVGLLAELGLAPRPDSQDHGADGG